MRGVSLDGISVIVGEGPDAQRVLNEITLEIHPGERVAIVGPNGSGKSTLLRAVAGLLPTVSGAIRFPGGTSRPVIGWMPQDYRLSLYPWWTAQRNALLRWRESDLAPGGRELLTDMFRFARIRPEAPPNALSGGQQQIVSFLRAVLRPAAELVLLDEPFSALDIDHRLHCRRALLEHSRARAQTLLLITHDLLEAAYVCDRIVLLHRDGSMSSFRVPRDRASENGTLGSEELNVVREIERHFYSSVP